ncbi:putative primosomal protein N' OS=Streptomyces tendae OX=1932 GN=priA PE=3 SV=1 [Streptomyces tendae]
MEYGWARPLVAAREQVRAAAPLVRTVGDQDLARDEAARAARLPSLACRPSGTDCRTDRYSCRCPGLATSCGWPARCAACACAGTARARWRDRSPEPRCAAAGAGARRAPGTARSAGPSGCGRRSWAPGAPRRSWAGLPGRARAHLRTGARAGHRVRGPGAGGEHTWGRTGRRGRIRGGTAARRLGDAGRPDLRAGEDALRRWLAAAALVRPQAPGAPSSRSPSRPAGRCRRWCAGTPSAMRCGSCPNGPSWLFRLARRPSRGRRRR